MTIYTATFRTDADYPERRFEADTPEQALALARAFYDEHTEDLMFESYDGHFVAWICPTDAVIPSLPDFI